MSQVFDIASEPLRRSLEHLVLMFQDDRELATRLGVTAEQLQIYLAGAALIPDRIARAMIDILVEREADQDPA